MANRFAVINRKDNMVLILDKQDFEPEWITVQQAKGYLNGGVKIDGLSIGDRNIVNIKIQKGCVPKSVMEHITNYCDENEDVDGSELRISLLSVQREGKNLKKLWELCKGQVATLAFEFPNLCKEV